MELRQLQCFVAVYEEGSVSGAARRLNVVQPALSVQVSKLEEDLGQTLFHRTSKGMSPTDAGHEAYRLVSAVLRDLEAVRQRLEQRKGQVKGTVALGVVSSVANNALGATLRTFAEKYPDVRVRATGGYTTGLIEMLRTGQLDAIVVNAAPDQHGTNVVDIVREKLALIAAARTELLQPVQLQDMARLRLVLPSRRHGLRLILDRALDEAQVTLLPQFEFDDLKPIADFIEGPGFFAILPPIAVHDALRAGRLRAFRIAPAISRRLVIMTSPSRPLTLAAELLITELRERMIDFTYDVETDLRDGAITAP